MRTRAGHLYEPLEVTTVRFLRRFFQNLLAGGNNGHHRGTQGMHRGSAGRARRSLTTGLYGNPVTHTPTSRLAPGGPTNEPATGGTDSGNLATPTAM